MKRKVHKFPASHISYDTAGVLTGKLNNDLCRSERIVSTVYVDGSWYVFTEDLGLGPRGDAK